MLEDKLYSPARSDDSLNERCKFVHTSFEVLETSRIPTDVPGIQENIADTLFIEKLLPNRLRDIFMSIGNDICPEDFARPSRANIRHIDIELDVNAHLRIGRSRNHSKQLE